MAREKGTFDFSSNFELRKPAPMDAKMRVGTTDDLISSTVWESNTGDIWTYPGMIVSVWDDPCTALNGVWVLLDADYTDASSWEQVGSATALQNLYDLVDSSLAELYQENDTQDSSIVNLRNEDIRQDGSLNLLFLENDIQDVSIASIYTYIDNSSGIYNTDPLPASVEMTQAFGDLSNKTAGELKGWSYDALFNTILFPTKDAYRNPPASFSFSVPTTWLEVGTIVTPTGTADYDPGEIYNGSDVDSGNQVTGDITQYIFKKNGSADTGGTYNSPGNYKQHVFTSSTIVESTNSNWSITYSYTVGTGVYYDNKGVAGTNLDSYRTAGSNITFGPLSVDGRFYSWYNFGDYGVLPPATSATVRALGNAHSILNSGSTTFTFTIASGKKWLWIALPSTVSAPSVFNPGTGETLTPSSTTFVTVTVGGGVGAVTEGYTIHAIDLGGTTGFGTPAPGCTMTIP